MKASIAAVAVFLLGAGSAPSAPLSEATVPSAAQALPVDPFDVLQMVKVGAGLGDPATPSFVWRGLISQQPCEDVTFKVSRLGAIVHGTPLSGPGELVAFETYAPAGGSAAAPVWLPSLETQSGWVMAFAAASESFVLHDAGIECRCISGPAWCIGRLWIEGWGVARACRYSDFGCTLDLGS